MGKNFIPSYKCEEFIKIVGSNNTFINLFSAANGVGKSCVGANIVANICFGPQNEFFNHPLYENFPYLKRGRIITDPTTIKTKIIPELKKWFPSNRYELKYSTKKESKPYEAKWTTDTGFEFDIMSNEQSAKEFESVDLGWIWMDEPSREDIYMASVARLRRGGLLFWTMTPLTYSAWIKDKIYDKRDGKFIETLTATVWDNCKQRDCRGILEEDDINKMISQYPDHEKLARVSGEFGHLLGLVHKTFDTKVHVVEPFSIDNKNFSVYMALDTHPRTPEAVLWLAVDEKGTKYIIDELWFKGTDAEIAHKIKQKEMAWIVKERLIDPSGYNEDKRSDEVSFSERLENLGLRFKPGSKKLLEGIRRTDVALQFEIKKGQMIKKPELFIFSSCLNLIKELQNYVWDEYSGKVAANRGPKPRPKDKDDHFIEDLHRLLLEEPVHYTLEDRNVEDDYDRFSVV